MTSAAASRYLLRLLKIYIACLFQQSTCCRGGFSWVDLQSVTSDVCFSLRRLDILLQEAEALGVELLNKMDCLKCLPCTWIYVIHSPAFVGSEIWALEHEWTVIRMASNNIHSMNYNWPEASLNHFWFPHEINKQLRADRDVIFRRIRHGSLSWFGAGTQWAVAFGTLEEGKFSMGSMVFFLILTFWELWYLLWL